VFSVPVYTVMCAVHKPRPLDAYWLWIGLLVRLGLYLLSPSITSSLITSIKLGLPVLFTDVTYAFGWLSLADYSAIILIAYS